jgi:hypothetical protein
LFPNLSIENENIHARQIKCRSPETAADSLLGSTKSSYRQLMFQLSFCERKWTFYISNDFESWYRLDINLIIKFGMQSLNSSSHRRQAAIKNAVGEMRFPWGECVLT